MAKEDVATDAELRTFALKSLKKKREFVNSAISFVIVNLGLIAVWFFTTPTGHFWPMWVLFGWGIGLGFQYVDAYVRPMAKPITDAEIDAEIVRLKGGK
jgi:hypothetical protein